MLHRMNNVQLLAGLVFLGFFACGTKPVDVIDQLRGRLDALETVRYRAISVGVEGSDGAARNDTALIYLDLREQNAADIRYYITNEADNAPLVYNGHDLIMLDNTIRQAIIADANHINPYNPLYFSLFTLREVLPLLLDHEAVRLREPSDTIIDGRRGRNLVFDLDSQYIDWEQLSISDVYNDGLVVANDMQLTVTVDLESYLPILISQTVKNKGYTLTTKLIDIDIDYVEKEDKIWDKSTYEDTYVVYTYDEFRQLNKNKLASAVGAPIGVHVLPTVGGYSRVNLADLGGRVVLLEFWFKGCGYCVLAIPELNSIYERYRDNDFELYGIEFVERYTKDVLQSYVADNGKAYPNLCEGKDLANALGIRGAPTVVVLDKSGKIVYAKFGFDGREVSAVIEAYL